MIMMEIKIGREIVKDAKVVSHPYPSRIPWTVYDRHKERACDIELKLATSRPSMNTYLVSVCATVDYTEEQLQMPGIKELRDATTYAHMADGSCCNVYFPAWRDMTDEENTKYPPMDTEAFSKAISSCVGETINKSVKEVVATVAPHHTEDQKKAILASVRKLTNLSPRDMLAVTMQIEEHSYPEIADRLYRAGHTKKVVSRQAVAKQLKQVALKHPDLASWIVRKPTKRGQCRIDGEERIEKQTEAFYEQVDAGLTNG